MEYKNLSDEQQKFIDLALRGHNVLVDACIGSGKTTAIQCLCNMIDPQKHVLYLTYNKLLKIDAQDRIEREKQYTQVTNYHGFASAELSKNNIESSMEEVVLDYNRACEQRTIQLPKCDVLILDEYQDVENEFAILLEHIKSGNPEMQIIAVGDMAQKIYDKTRLNVMMFIHQFLGTYIQVEFTKCFRLSKPLAEKLGKVWHKTINGVNPECGVYLLSFRQTLEYLKKCEPQDILCLGANKGLRNTMLNYLEKECPDKFNKFSVWSNIRDSGDGSTSPNKESAIFTTYDGCKGMERDICVIFDWSESYWNMRLDMAQTKYEIMRNVFCVAASRGKKKIIFVKSDDLLTWDLLEKSMMDSTKIDRQVSISQMFDFKYIEDVTDAYNQLAIREVSPKSSIINVSTSEGLIDLSPCIGIYQEVAYFDHCSIEEYIKDFFEHNAKKASRRLEINEEWTLDEKVLFYVSLMTDQDRYMNQVSLPLVQEDTLDKIKERLSTVLPSNAIVQRPCQFEFDYRNAPLTAYGIADAIMNGVVYELKFVDELAHTHFLQCAMYMAAMGLKKGVLWNVRNNQRFEIRIPDMRTFLDKVVFAVTKGSVLPTKYIPVPNVPSATISMPAGKKAVAVPPNKSLPAAAETSVDAAPQKHHISNYKPLFLAFCDQNKKACKKAVQLSKKAEKENKRMGPVRLEKAFRDMGVNLPFSARTFSKYWKEYCESLSKSAKRRSKKKSA